MTSRRWPAPPQNRPTSQRYDHFIGMQRRAAAKRECRALTECGCIVDPEFDRHRCGDEITDKMVWAAVVAAEHLDNLGTPGLFGDRICRAMYRAGHRDRAITCFSYSSGEAA